MGSVTRFFAFFALGREINGAATDDLHVSGRKSIRDDFVNLGRKTITEMGCADFDMLDLDIVVIDASTPRHDGISAVTGLRSTILFVMRSPLPSDRDRNRDD
jgi:hypothetical protein